MRFHWLLLPLLLTIVSCGPPDAETQGDMMVETIAIAPPPSAEAFVPRLEGPLRPISVAPSGSLTSFQPGFVVSVTFSKPMTPLGETIPIDPNQITLEPYVEGTLRWEGTQTLVFEPATRPPAATAYTATLKAGLTSIDGSRMDEPYSWTFDTPRPQLTRSEPASYDQYVHPDAHLYFYFNQALDTTRLAPYFSIRNQNRNERVNFDLVVENDSTIELIPRGQLGQGITYQIEVEPGVPSAYGPLGSLETVQYNFRIYPEAAFLSVTQERDYEVISTNLSPSRGVNLGFSTRVSFENLRKALSITPDVALPAGIESRDPYISESHRLPMIWQPETTYTIRIDSLEDVHGQVISSSSRQFTTAAYKPSLSIPTGMLVIEADERPVLPLFVTNVAQTSYGVERIAANNIIPRARTYDGWGGYYNNSTALSTDQQLVLDIERNVPETKPFDLAPQLIDSTGIVGVRMLGPVEQLPNNTTRQRKYSALVQVTRLGISAKFSPHQNLFFVTDLQTAEPVGGAKVTVRGSDNQVFWEGTTDESGRAQSPGWFPLGMSQSRIYADPDQYVIVEKDGDVAYTSNLYNRGLEPYRFGIGYGWYAEDGLYDAYGYGYDYEYDAKNKGRSYKGLVFTDRGLYREGETVHLKGMVRQKSDGEWSATRDSVHVTIDSPDGERVFEDRFLPGEMGTFAFDWISPESATLGSYYIAMRLTDNDETYVANGNFRVDAFRRATFAVETQSLANAYISGGFFEGVISGHYLFGAAMQDQPVRYTLRQNAAYYAPPGYDGYGFSSWRNRGYYNNLIASGDSLLDEEGMFKLRAQIPPSTNGIPTKITLNATVTDPARQESSSQTETIVHPALFYIGLKPGTTFLDLGTEDEMTIDLITVDPAGQPHGERYIKTQLIREQWSSVREIGSDGRLRWRSTRTEEVKIEETLSTEAGKARRLTLPIEEGGSYIFRAESRDVRGNQVLSETHFYATGSGYVAWQRSDDDRIELVPEKKSYQPGETARIMVQSPFEEATALVTVEREGVMSSKVVTLTGSAPQIEIPITDAHMPNVFVSVMLITGRTAPPDGSASDPGAPAFKMGYIPITVDPGKRHLAVEIVPDKETYRPGDEVTVDLTLKDPDGRGIAGEIAFSAADAGVLNLIGYTLPDPFSTYYGPRALGVITSQTLSSLIKQRSYGQKEEDEGGGGGDDQNDGVRKDFRPSAYWNPAIQTDERGRAQISFRLPESLTTFRFMANALTADNMFGSSQTDVIVTKPLVLKPALPRFARLGDHFEAGVLITNTTGKAGEATVTVEAQDITLDGPANKQVQLDHGETKEVRFVWTIAEAGDALLQFKASLGAESDAFEVTLPAQLPTIKTTQGTFASTQDEASEQIRIPASVVAEMGGFEAQVSSTALVGLDGAAKYLFRYPYGCLEQRTSRIRPLIAGDALLETFDLSPLDGERDRLIQEWLGDLRTFWVGNGFTMWTGGRHVHPYVTAYVVAALAEAREAGFAVPEPLTTNAVNVLENHVKTAASKPDYYGQRTWNDTRAFMLYALARHERFLDQEINTLSNSIVNNAQFISVSGKSHLLRTLIRRQNTRFDAFEQQLVQNLVSLLRVESTQAYLTASQDADARWIFSSDTRSTAFGLTALIESKPPEETRRLIDLMVRYLMNTRQAGHWASTQENVAVIEALSLFRENYEADTPDFTAEIQLAGRTILEETFKGRSLDSPSEQVSLTTLPAGETIPISIKKEGTGSLYYTLRLESYSTEPVGSLDQGLSVERIIRHIDESGQLTGNLIGTSDGTIDLIAGDMVQVTLRLTSPATRNYVVVDDPLPAGLEALNAAFLTTNPDLMQNTGSGQWWGSFNHTEIRDDRVLLFADYLNRGEHTYTYVARATTPGTFIHPPVQAELMYQPEINGRNASGTVRVVVPGPDTASR